ncbi:MAG TPA: nitroreductase family protein [Bacteroidales bacterium]|nr:nitroreductase family protein [Bacteroidales bacterium]
MDLKSLVLKNRSYRRFNETHKVEYPVLEKLIDLARFTPSAGNRQPLKFLLFNTPEKCDRIFPSLSWAGYLKEWPGPEEGERPSAYVVILGDKSIFESFGTDLGIVAQTIMLGAAEIGLGGCMIQSIKKEDLRQELKLPDIYEILLVLAIGKPVEEVVIDDVKSGEIKYWRDVNKIHHVPKRNLSDLILKL